MKYIIDPLVLCYNRFFFVYVFFFCFHGCLRSIFCGFGAYYACVLEHLDLVFLFYPSSDLEFFFWFAAMLTRFMRMSENRDLSDKLLRYSLLSTYFHYFISPAQHFGVV